MFKNFLPKKILSSSNKLINNLLFLMIFIIIIGLIFSLFLSPQDYIQGDSVRIMYVHVPASFLALGFFGFIGIASILNLVFKIKFVTLMAKSIAPIGCVFALISIITGSLWGKPTWGVWWAWDARLTSMIVLLLLYLTYIFLWNYVKNFEDANKLTSAIGIIGLFNLPVIKYSVDWWSTLHQTSSISLTSAPTIHSSMLVPLVIMFAAMIIYSLIIFYMRYKAELIKFKINKRNKNN